MEDSHQQPAERAAEREIPVSEQKDSNWPSELRLEELGQTKQQTSSEPTKEREERVGQPPLPLNLPEISSGPNLSDLFGPPSPVRPTPMAEKRASNVARLAEESAKLNAELKAMSDRLEAAERKRRQIEVDRRMRESEHANPQQQQQYTMERP